MRRTVRRGVTTATTKYHTAYRALSRGRKAETTGASDVVAPAQRRRTRVATGDYDWGRQRNTVFSQCGDLSRTDARRQSKDCRAASRTLKSPIEKSAYRCAKRNYAMDKQQRHGKHSKHSNGTARTATARRAHNYTRAARNHKRNI